MVIMSDYEKICSVNDLQPGQRKSIIVDDVPVLLVRAGDAYYAIEDVCTHDGQPLTDGPMNDHEITCPRHGARFELKTGKQLCMPATTPIATFEVQVRDDGIYVKTEN